MEVIIAGSPSASLESVYIGGIFVDLEMFGILDHVLDETWIEAERAFRRFHELELLQDRARHVVIDAAIGAAGIDERFLKHREVRVLLRLVEPGHSRNEA